MKSNKSGDINGCPLAQHLQSHNYTAPAAQETISTLWSNISVCNYEAGGQQSDSAESIHHTLPSHWSEAQKASLSFVNSYWVLSKDKVKSSSLLYANIFSFYGCSSKPLCDC